MVPNPLNLPEGCLFKRRCPYAMPICDTPPPLQEVAPGQLSRCWLTPAGEPPAVGADAPPARSRPRRPPSSRSRMTTETWPTTARPSPPLGAHSTITRAAAGAWTAASRRRADADRRSSSVNDVVKHFAIRGGVMGVQLDRRRAGGGRRQLRRSPRRDARPRRRVRLRQDDAGQGHPAADPGHRRVRSTSTSRLHLRVSTTST